LKFPFIAKAAVILILAYAGENIIRSIEEGEYATALEIVTHLTAQIILSKFSGPYINKTISSGKGTSGNVNEIGSYLSKKAPKQVTAGTKFLKGQYVDDLGRVQPWKAYYDKYGRLIARTDYNAGNKAAGIPNTHYHIYEWGPGKTPFESGSHIEGEFLPW
ncbi:hypothetical protein RBH29_13705, partial [Herbivorax sp. ANBcel31]|uniref:hypothetical protein n=1 Tax=Herbivorax sp. ANBcel31 TaxID=3069754 RepID=UPI0027B3A467